MRISGCDWHGASTIPSPRQRIAGGFSDGERIASFTTLFTRDALLPGVAFFFRQRHTLQFVRNPGWTQHPNEALCLLWIEVGGLVKSRVTGDRLSEIFDNDAITDDAGSSLLVLLGAHFVSWTPRTSVRLYVGVEKLGTVIDLAGTRMSQANG